MARIAIVDDHELLAEALRIALADLGIEATRVAPRELPLLLDAVQAEAPGLVLLDLDLGRFGDATPLIAPLTRAGIRVVVITGIEDRMRIAAALEQGAMAYRSKADGFERLLETVAAAAAATGPLDPDTRTRLLGELRLTRGERARRMAPFALLTDREQDTLRCIARGMSVHDIAGRWVVSEATVRTHVRGVLGKLDVRSQLAAVAVALHSGWLQDAPPGVDQVCTRPTRYLARSTRVSDAYGCTPDGALTPS